MAKIHHVVWDQSLDPSRDQDETYQKLQSLPQGEAGQEYIIRKVVTYSTFTLVTPSR
jgi:hypothetical protein